MSFINDTPHPNSYLYHGSTILDKAIKAAKRRRGPHMGSSYWYLLHVTECPVCGARDTWRERVVGDKPKDPAKRIEFKLSYDNCDR